jgi:hypothetical protein
MNPVYNKIIFNNNLSISTQDIVETSEKSTLIVWLEATQIEVKDRDIAYEAYRNLSLRSSPEFDRNTLRRMGAYIRYQKILVRQIQHRISEINKVKRRKGQDFHVILMDKTSAFWRKKAQMLAPEYMSKFYNELTELEGIWRKDFESRQL